MIFNLTGVTLKRVHQIISHKETPTEKRLGDCLKDGCKCPGFKPKKNEIAVCTECRHICEWHRGVKAKEIPE